MKYYVLGKRTNATAILEETIQPGKILNGSYCIM